LRAATLHYFKETGRMAKLHLWKHRAWGGKVLEELPAGMQEVWKILGYNKELWNDDEMSQDRNV
jgi:hypothetical protein